jgi:hypothetical protein
MACIAFQQKDLKVSPIAKMTGGATLDPTGQSFNRCAADEVDGHSDPPCHGQFALGASASTGARVPQANDIVRPIGDEACIDIDDSPKEGRPVATPAPLSVQFRPRRPHASHQSPGAAHRVDRCMPEVHFEPQSEFFTPFSATPGSVLHAA